MLKATLTLFLAIVLSVIIYLNYKLYYQPQFITIEGTEINADVYAQLNFLEKEMRNGAAEDMQAVYPEGYIFMNALYGLSWAEFASTLNHKSDLYQQSHLEVQRAFAHMASKKGRSTFDKSLKISYGAFYTGWTSYVLGKKLSIEDVSSRDSAEIKLFNFQCQQMAAFVDSSTTPYAESYAGFAWPADMTLCIASLALHDRIMEPQYQTTIQSWIKKVSQNFDSTGLMPHSVDPNTGRPKENGRGSSQSLMLNFLPEIDKAFAKDQFDIYRKYFLVKRLGLPGLREYPKGVEGNKDSDSGPIVWGVGGAASIVGLRVMILGSDTTTAIGLRNSIEAFGIPIKSGENKKYLFGSVPIADAFIVWANSTETTKSKTLNSSQNWRVGFQFFSLAISVMLILLLVWVWKKK